MRVLITGIAGFAGSFLAEHLLAQGYDVWGVVRHGAGHVSHCLDRLTLRTADMRDLGRVVALLEEAQPARIYHLAAQAFVPTSWDQPWETLENNIRGQLNLFLALLDLAMPARVLVVGSNEEYGVIHPDVLPISESTPFRPNSPYAVSKIAQDMLGLQYWESHELHVIRVRPFNHIGPRQSARFVAASFARQIAEIEAGMRSPAIKVGNLEAKRDFSDVRDVVRAYHLALERGQPGDVYNVGSGEAHSVQELLDTLLAYSPADVRIEKDPARMRPSDVPASYADISKITSAVGWRPRVPFKESVHAVLDYWRTVVRRPKREVEEA